MKTITLNVCHGIGDTFWVYQKFAKHFDEINFNISLVNQFKRATQLRAKPFLEFLPKVKSVQVTPISPSHYDKIAHGYFDMKNIFKEYENGKRVFDYGCNDLLERGVRLEEIDPEYPIEETVDLPEESFPIGFDPKDYITLYLSGGSQSLTWKASGWRYFTERFCDRFDMEKKFVIIGAHYDRHVATEVSDLLRNDGCETRIHIDRSPQNVIHVIKNSRCFIGYQSGLSILADNLDVPQVMMYLPNLQKMMYTWAKKTNIKKGIYNAAVFGNLVHIFADLQRTFLRDLNTKTKLA